MDSLLPSRSRNLHSPAVSALTRTLGFTEQRPIIFHLLSYGLYGVSFDIASEKPEGGCVGVCVGCERAEEIFEVSVRRDESGKEAL